MVIKNTEMFKLKQMIDGLGDKGFATAVAYAWACRHADYGRPHVSLAEAKESLMKAIDDSSLFDVMIDEEA